MEMKHPYRKIKTSVQKQFQMYNSIFMAQICMAILYNSQLVPILTVSTDQYLISNTFVYIGILGTSSICHLTCRQFGNLHLNIKLSLKYLLYWKNVNIQNCWVKLLQAFPVYAKLAYGNPQSS